MKEFPSNGAKLHDYEAFIAIVDTGNLTRAAARLRRSLQSVSRSLVGARSAARRRPHPPHHPHGAAHRSGPRLPSTRERGVSRDRARRGRAQRHIGNVERNALHRGLRLLCRPPRRSGHSRLLAATSECEVRPPHLRRVRGAGPHRGRPHDPDRPASALADEVAQDRLASTRRDRFALVRRTARSTRDSGRSRAARLHHSHVGARRSRVDVPRSGRDSPSAFRSRVCSKPTTPT